MERHKAVHQLCKADLLLNNISSTLDIINQCPNPEVVKKALSKDLANAATYIVEVCGFIIDSKEQESILLNDINNIFTIANEIEKKLFGIHKLINPDIFNIRAIINNIKDARKYNTPEPQQPTGTLPHSNDTRGAQQKGINNKLDEERIRKIIPYIEEAIRNDLCRKSNTNGMYIWEPKEDNPYQLLAYMAREICLKEQIYKRYDRKKNKDIYIVKWSIFEKIFNLKKDSLKNNYYSLEDVEPKNKEIIDKIIDAVWKKRK